MLIHPIYGIFKILFEIKFPYAAIMIKSGLRFSIILNSYVVKVLGEYILILYLCANK